MIERTLLNDLKEWLGSSNRKPVVIRGARQVGKTWLVTHLAKVAGKQLVELNFEKNPSYARFFEPNDPQQILSNIALATRQVIDPANALLFLDEIQAAPQLFSKLRWFAEDMPQLPVVATGSLLEFMLSHYPFSVPVGRIGYMYLEPLSFEEFLLAQDRKSLCEYLAAYDFNTTIVSPIHELLMKLFKEYLLIGGMPAAVNEWISSRSFQKVQLIQNNLLGTYRDDFSRYKGHTPVDRLDDVMMNIPKMLGQKIVFSRFDDSIPASAIKQTLGLLEKARVCHRVRASSGNGVPLAGEVREKYFKEIFLDVGLCNRALAVDLHEITTSSEITVVNSGGIAEQVVGQLLRTIEPFYVEPALYCWYREEATANAEIDYLLQHQGRIVPIEVKAGARGSLKSLHMFMQLKQLLAAVRINSDLPTRTMVEFKSHTGGVAKYTLLSLPFYLIGQLHRLLGRSASTNP